MPLCGNDDESHEHVSECYELECGMDAHGLTCYSNPDADLEEKKTWEATFAHIELIGNWNEDVLAIAQTQLGYTESSRNYAVWEDNSTHGYTRYGQWYGDPYGDWCAMFASFCLNYAEVEGMPLHRNISSWIEELTELKLYHDSAVYEPKPGDLIFFDWDGDGISDHVGLVNEIIPETDTAPAKIKTIEVNSSNRVQCCYSRQENELLPAYRFHHQCRSK